MTTSSGLTYDRRPPGEADDRGVCDPRAVLHLIGDEYSQQILACGDMPLTASELAERCDLPLSTTYRKIDQLLDAGLLEESIRLSAQGKHSTEYRRAMDGVHVSFQGGLDVDCQVG